MIRIENLDLTLDGAPILRGIDTTIPASGLTAVIGPNGNPACSTASPVSSGRRAAASPSMAPISPPRGPPSAPASSPC